MKKSKMLIFLVMTTMAVTAFVGCGKDDDNSSFSGNWVNERNDTISFMSEGMFAYYNFSPRYMWTYSCKIEGDSISLFPGHSSNLNDRKKHIFQYEANEMILYQFNDMDKAIYKRLKK